MCTRMFELIAHIFSGMTRDPPNVGSGILAPAETTVSLRTNAPKSPSVEAVRIQSASEVAAVLGIAISATSGMTKPRATYPIQN